MLKKYLKILFACLLIFLLLYQVGVAELINELSKISLAAVLYLVLISVLLIYISALKWKLFLEVFSHTVSVYKLFCLYLVGYFVNLLLPSYIGGDAVRSWQIGKKVGQHQALAATVLERYTGGLAMLSMAFIFMWLVSQITWQIRLAVLLVCLAYFLLSLFVISPYLTGVLKFLRLPENLIKHAVKIRDALNFARGNIRLFLSAMLLSYTFHIFTVVNVMAAAYAIGWYEAPFLDLVVVLPIILLIGSLPLTPSGLGLQEGAFFFFLQGLGATPGEAVAVAVILRAKSYLLALFGGVAWFFVRINPAQEVKIESM